MKLDRNINDGKGKYALIKMRRFDPQTEGDGTFGTIFADPQIVPLACIDFGFDGEDFLVIRLKDKYASAAFRAYAQAAEADDPEYAAEISALADAADAHPNRKVPD